MHLSDVLYLSWKPYLNQYRQFSWYNNTNLAFVHQDKIYNYNINKKQKQELTSLKKINSLLKKQKSDTLKKLSMLTWITQDTLLVKNKQECYRIIFKNNKIKKAYNYQLESANIEICPATGHIAWTKKNNIYITTTTINNRRITTDSNKHIVYGKTVSRREFGITKGMFWSPKGNLLAFYCKNIKDVGEYPVYELNDSSGIKMIRYPMAGTQSEYITLGIYNTRKNKTTYINAGKKHSNNYITSVTWGPDEKYIYCGILNRGQDHLKLNKYRAEDGKKINTLFEEKDKQYVEPQHQLSFLHGNQDQFIWLSRRDGYYHAYLYDTSGTMLKQLTSGAWDIYKIKRITDDDRLMAFIANKEDPMNFYLYVVNLQSLEIKKVSRHKGCHNGKLSANGKYMLDWFSTTEIPRCVEILDLKGNNISTLTKKEKPFTAYQILSPETGTLKAADGITDLFYKIIKPPGMEPGRQYPAIVYIYGGPHNQLVKNCWPSSFECWQYYMAQKGYVVFTMDNRGSAFRGEAFEQTIHRNLGNKEMEDQLTGLAWLKKQEFIDTGRIGIYGWSYGGFMAMSLLIHYPDVFTCGIAGAPVTNWDYYEMMYGERYMDTPMQNPQGYARSDLPSHAGNLENDLLIIHGANDSTVVLQNSLQFVKACINSGASDHLEYFVYPGSDHHINGWREQHLFEKMENYFDERLLQKK